MHQLHNLQYFNDPDLIYRDLQITLGVSNARNIDKFSKFPAKLFSTQKNI